MAVAYEIKSDVAQVDGRRSVQINYTTHTGQMASRTLLVPSDYDAVSGAETGASELEETFKQKEIQSMASVVERGDKTIPEIIAGFQWMTIEDALREVIRWGVEGEDPRALVNMESVFNFVEASFTDEQIQAMTGVTQGDIDTYRSRVSSILSIGSVKDTLISVDSTRGTISG